MGAAQSTRKMAIEDILQFLEEEVKKLDDNVKNLKESWKTKKSWVPKYLTQLIEETETRWINIKSIIPVSEESNDQIKYPEAPKQLARCCQEIKRTTEAKIIQLQKNNETLLRNKQKTEMELIKLKKTATEQQYKDQRAPSKPGIEGNGESGNTTLKQSQHRADDVLNLPQNAFVKKMVDFEEKSKTEIEKLKTENEKLTRDKNYFEERLKVLEKANRSKEGLDTGSSTQQTKETPQESLQLSDDKQSDAKDEMLRKQANEMEEKQKSRNEELTKENNRLQERIYILEKENENAEMLTKDKKASENITKSEPDRSRQRNEELIKKQCQQANTTREKQTGTDYPKEALRKQCQQMENKNLELIEQRDVLQAEKDTLQIYSNQIKEERDELLLRLSKFAGDKLVDNNPAITDLSDPNRPTKLGEFYSEIYDNEWTNAFEALVDGDYDEITAIETLRLTLLNVIQFCESKADLLLQKASDAVNLLFEEYRQSVMEIRTPSHLTMPKRQARDVAQFVRREKSSLEDIKLQRRWELKPNKIKGDAKASSEKVQKEEQSKLNADTKLKQLRKDMASSMVPIVQKAYIETSWTNRCIEELKPYILKCLYLGWMMVVQSPPLVLHEFPTEKEIKFDKNMYKEYTASGPLVSYVVWPALLLKENGPVVCKGVAEGKKP